MSPIANNNMNLNLDASFDNERDSVRESFVVEEAAPSPPAGGMGMAAGEQSPMERLSQMIKTLNVSQTPRPSVTMLPGQAVTMLPGGQVQPQQLPQQMQLPVGPVGGPAVNGLVPEGRASVTLLNTALMAPNMDGRVSVPSINVVNGAAPLLSNVVTTPTAATTGDLTGRLSMLQLVDEPQKRASMILPQGFNPLGQSCLPGSQVPSARPSLIAGIPGMPVVPNMTTPTTVTNDADDFGVCAPLPRGSITVQETGSRFSVSQEDGVGVSLPAPPSRDIDRPDYVSIKSKRASVRRQSTMRKMPVVCEGPIDEGDERASDNEQEGDNTKSTTVPEMTPAASPSLQRSKSSKGKGAGRRNNRHNNQQWNAGYDAGFGSGYASVEQLAYHGSPAAMYGAGGMGGDAAVAAAAAQWEATAAAMAAYGAPGFPSPHHGMGFPGMPVDPFTGAPMVNPYAAAMAGMPIPSPSQLYAEESAARAGYGGSGYNSKMSETTTSQAFSQPNKNYPSFFKNGMDVAKIEELRLLIRGNPEQLVRMASESAGSRKLQDLITFVTKHRMADYPLLVSIFAPHVYRLSKDLFGNYVVQRLIEDSNAAERDELCQQLKGHVLELAMNKYACRVLQKATTTLSEEQVCDLAYEVTGHVCRLAMDQNGNHVIQKIFETPKACQMLFSEFLGHTQTVAKHVYGCRVLQRMIELHGVQLAPLLDEMCTGTTLRTLSFDQYGNYVLQYILTYGRENDLDSVLEAICENVYGYACHKYASNITEKVMDSFRGRPQVDRICEALLAGEKRSSDAQGFDGDDLLCRVTKDQFGNYIVQKLMQLLSDSMLKSLMAGLKVNLTRLEKSTYGKHIIYALKEQGYMSEYEVNMALTKQSSA